MKNNVTGSRSTVMNSLSRIALKPRNGFMAPPPFPRTQSAPQTHPPATAGFPGDRRYGSPLRQDARASFHQSLPAKPGGALIGQRPWRYGPLEACEWFGARG